MGKAGAGILDLGMKTSMLGFTLDKANDVLGSDSGGGRKKSKNPYKPRSLLQPNQNASNATPVKRGGADGLLN